MCRPVSICPYVHMSVIAINDHMSVIADAEINDKNSKRRRGGAKKSGHGLAG